MCLIGDPNWTQTSLKWKFLAPSRRNITSILKGRCRRGCPTCKQQQSGDRQKGRLRMQISPRSGEGAAMDCPVSVKWSSHVSVTLYILNLADGSWPRSRLPSLHAAPRGRTRSAPIGTAPRANPHGYRGRSHTGLGQSPDLREPTATVSAAWPRRRQPEVSRDWGTLPSTTSPHHSHTHAHTRLNHPKICWALSCRQTRRNPRVGRITAWGGQSGSPAPCPVLSFLCHWDIKARKDTVKREKIEDT